MSRVPTYEYACKQCGEHLEVVQKFTDEPLSTCPACQGTLRKVFGTIGISFKGSGFYKNDSRTSDNGGKHKDRDKDKEPVADKGSSGDADGGKTKADAPAAKPDAPKSAKGSSTAAAS